MTMSVLVTMLMSVSMLMPVAMLILVSMLMTIFLQVHIKIIRIQPAGHLPSKVQVIAVHLHTV